MIKTSTTKTTMSYKNAKRLPLAEEQALTKKAVAGCQASTAELIQRSSGFITSMARKYARHNICEKDLSQEGNVGMLLALKKFDPDQGNTFLTFAVHDIKSQMLKFVENNNCIVKYVKTKPHKKVFYNINRFKGTDTTLSQTKVEMMAQELNVKPSEILHIENHLGKHHVHYDTLDAPDEDGFIDSPEYSKDYLSCHADNFEEDELITKKRSLLKNSINNLNERDQIIVSKRYLEDTPHTLKEVGDTFNISAERVRQLERNILRRIQENPGVSSFLQASA